MIVMKFGGTSVANADRIKRLKDIVATALKEHKKVGVIVSAFGGLTDHLISTAEMAQAGDDQYHTVIDGIYQRHSEAIGKLFNKTEAKVLLAKLQEKTKNLRDLIHGVYLVKELSPRVLDCVVSYGELVSSIIIAAYLKKHLKTATWLDSRDMIRTNSDFGAAKVDFEVTNKQIAKATKGAKGVWLMGGFVASNENAVTTTLGRGGSDYSAAILAAATKAKVLEIWTDVDGVMTSDPRKVKKAFTLPSMTYEEALEMSHFGAKVIHPPTIQPVLEKGISLRIRNSFNPSFPGTLISEQANDEHPVKGITSLGKIALLTVQGSGMVGVAGISGRLFSALANRKVNIILITQASSEHSITFAIKPDDISAAKTAIKDAFAYEIRSGQIDPVVIEKDLSVVAVIGSNMRNTTGVAGRMFESLGKNGVNIRAIAQGSSELNISAAVGKEDEAKSLNVLHETFFLSDTRSVNIFVLGTGLIAKTLLKQIQSQAKYLKEHQSLEVKLTGISNTRQMLTNEDGITIKKWDKELAENGEKAKLAAFIKQMIDMNLSNSILVDCTASSYPIKHYAKVLTNSISIVTPNKIANSGSMEDYLHYNFLAKKHGVKFLYETNVGAGLPVISTMQDLMQSGDAINKIEAVLSGSMSFVFNSFDGSRPFSEIVKEAQEKGFTEPDPREDLSGKDVARKALILAREMGLHVNPADVEVENILPAACVKAKTVDQFFEALEKNDDHFSALQTEAAKKGKVLRFMASIDKKKMKVGLQAVDMKSPFYPLAGSDNMIVFHTKRYSNTPLVVKGPGAGAEVTAAGVFAEIITISNYLK